VFVECNGYVAGIEALVFDDGAVTLPAHKFRDLLKTYKGTPSLTFERNAKVVRIQSFQMPVLAYNTTPKPPGDFQVFPSTSQPVSITSQRRT
jgi:hypothetical protein